MDALSTVINPTFRLFCSESRDITDATLEVGDPSFSAPFELVAQKIPCARRSILPVPQGPLPAEARTFIRILPVCNEPHAGCVSHLCISRLQKMVDRGLLPHEVIFRERLYRQIDPRTSFIRELQDRAHSLPPREFTQYLIAHRCHLLSFACCMRPLDSQMSEGYEICTNPYSVVRRDESYKGRKSYVMLLTHDNSIGFYSLRSESGRGAYKIVRRLDALSTKDASLTSLALAIPNCPLDRTSDSPHMSRVKLSLKKQCSFMVHLTKRESMDSSHLLSMVPLRMHFERGQAEIQCGLMEFCEGGTIDRVRKSVFSEKQCMLMALELVFSVADLHKREIYHFDLKAQNVLLQIREDGPHCKLGDFGFVVMNPLVELGEGPSMTYIPPEMIVECDRWWRTIEDYAEKKKRYEKVDIWLLADILFLLRYKKKPRYGEYLLTRKTCQGRLISHEACFREMSRLLGSSQDPFDQMLLKMYDLDPRKRPTADDVAREIRLWLHRMDREACSDEGSGFAYSAHGMERDDPNQASLGVRQLAVPPGEAVRSAVPSVQNKAQEAARSIEEILTIPSPPQQAPVLEGAGPPGHIRPTSPDHATLHASAGVVGSLHSKEEDAEDLIALFEEIVTRVPPYSHGEVQAVIRSEERSPAVPAAGQQDRGLEDAVLPGSIRLSRDLREEHVSDSAQVQFDQERIMQDLAALAQEMRRSALSPIQERVQTVFRLHGERVPCALPFSPTSVPGRRPAQEGIQPWSPSPVPVVRCAFESTTEKTIPVVGKHRSCCTIQ